MKRMSNSQNSCERGECGCQLQRALVGAEKFLHECDTPKILNIATHLRNVLRRIYETAGMENDAMKRNCPLEKIQKKLGVWKKDAESYHRK